MKTLTREQVRQIDRTAIEQFGIPGIVLMENAGRNITDVLCRQNPSGTTLILCGSGNNAGDGLVVARHLKLRGRSVQLVLCTPPEKFHGDAAIQYDITQKLGFPCVEVYSCHTTLEMETRLNPYLTETEWLVDALLGTGATGEPRFPMNIVIPWMNASGKKILAVDIPSGLDCDTGFPASVTVQANITCTLAAMKPGLVDSPFTGEIHVLDIGFPPCCFETGTIR